MQTYEHICRSIVCGVSKDCQNKRLSLTLYQTNNFYTGPN